jgi:hypothetical protein
MRAEIGFLADLGDEEVVGFELHGKTGSPTVRLVVDDTFMKSPTASLALRSGENSSANLECSPRGTRMELAQAEKGTVRFDLELAQGPHFELWDSELADSLNLGRFDNDLYIGSGHDRRINPALVFREGQLVETRTKAK